MYLTHLSKQNSKGKCQTLRRGEMNYYFLHQKLVTLNTFMGSFIQVSLLSLFIDGASELGDKKDLYNAIFSIVGFVLAVIVALSMKKNYMSAFVGRIAVNILYHGV
jgi:hypothetical protein